MKSSHALWAVAALTVTGAWAAAQEPVSDHGHFAEVNGARIYYEDQGQGEPLLLLHAFFRTATNWKRYAEDWAPRYRVIAWDARGHGRSTNPDTSDVFLHAEAARDLLGLMDSLGIQRTRAIGASTGAMTLLHAATMAPERFEALVLIGAQTYFSETTRKGLEAAGSREHDPGRMRRYAQIHGPSNALQLVRQFWRFRNLYGDPAFTPDMLATISARVLVIQGDDDPYIPISQPLEMHRSIPGARLWIVPNGGHHPHHAPGNHDDLRRRVSEFLENNWDGPSK